VFFSFPGRFYYEGAFTKASCGDDFAS